MEAHWPSGQHAATDWAVGLVVQPAWMDPWTARWRRARSERAHSHMEV